MSLGHVVERFGELADFRRAAHRHALVKFGAADRSRGLHQAANRPGDPEREQISENQRHKSDDHHETQRFCRQFLHARIHARLVHAALRDHRPVQFRNRAVRSDHFRRVFLPFLGA